MYRTDRPGVTVMAHSGDFAERILVEAGIGDYYPQRRIFHKPVLQRLDTLLHHFGGIRKAASVFGEHAGNLPSAFPVKDISQCIQGDNGPDFQIALLQGIASDAGFHASLHTGDFSHGGAAAGAVIAVSVVCFLKSLFTGLISHRLIGIHIGCPHGQVEKVGLYHQRHSGHAHVKADAVLLKIPHDAAGRRKAEGTPAGKYNAVYLLGRGQRGKQRRLPGGGSSAPHIQSRMHTGFAEKNRASGARLSVFRLSDSDISDIVDRYFLHGFPPL